MEMLPPELYWTISEYASRDDFRALRQVSKRCCAAVTPILFHTIDIFPFRESYEWIAANPEIQRHVRCVRYVLKILRRHDGVYAWKVAGIGSNLSPIGWAAKETITPTDLRLAYERYCYYLASQDDVFKGQTELNYLKNLFKSLTNLREVQIVYGCDHGLFSNEIKDFKDTHIITQQTLVGLQCGLHYNYDMTRIQKGTNFHGIMPWILFAAQSNNRLLDALTIHSQGWLSFDNFFWKPLVQDTLASVRHLTLGFVGTLDHRNPSKLHSNISAFIATPDELDTLDFSHGWPGALKLPNEPIRLEDILRHRQIWKTLRTLKLTGIHVGHRFLTTFLTDHAQRLRVLGLTNVHITQDSPRPAESSAWLQTFNLLRDCLSLSKVTFNGAIIGPSDSERWDVRGDKLPCCIRGGFHTTCLKGRLENYIVNGGDWVPEPILKVGPDSKSIAWRDFLLGDKSWAVADAVFPN